MKGASAGKKKPTLWSCEMTVPPTTFDNRRALQTPLPLTRPFDLSVTPQAHFVRNAELHCFDHLVGGIGAEYSTRSRRVGTEVGPEYE